MITRHRGHFLTRSLRYFLEQDYVNRELIIFDSSDAPSVDRLIPEYQELIRKRGQIRYYHYPAREDWTIGYLRNLANDVTNGDLIAHWDDDDWYHPNRLSYQVDQLGNAEVGGFSSCLWWDELSDPPCIWKYDNASGWALGSGLIYKRPFWRANQFPHVAAGEENALQDLTEHKSFPGVLPDRVYMIARMHDRNSQREAHAGIRRIWEQDPERINLVWSKIEDQATIEKVKGLLA